MKIEVDSHCDFELLVVVDIVEVVVVDDCTTVVVKLTVEELNIPGVVGTRFSSFFGFSITTVGAMIITRIPVTPKIIKMILIGNFFLTLLDYNKYNI